jgi:hypothetical protein
MNLAAVPDNEPSRTPSIPLFEGKEVSETKITLSRVSGLPAVNVDRDSGRPYDEVLRTDDIVRFYVEGRVVGVNHKVDQKTGKLIRIQTVEAVELDFAPWDANDPTDHGVAR